MTKKATLIVYIDLFFQISVLPQAVAVLTQSLQLYYNGAK